MEAAGRREALAVIDELLHSDERDVGAFVGSALEVMTLEALRTALGTRIAGTKADLISAINSDYSVFVSLSAALEGSGSSVLRLQRPLARVAAQLGEVAGASAAHARELQAAREGMRSASASAAAAEALAAALEALEGARGALGVLAGASASAAPPSAAAPDSEWAVDVSQAHHAWEAASSSSSSSSSSSTGSTNSSSGSSAEAAGSGAAAAALLPPSTPHAMQAWLAGPLAATARAHTLCRASRLLQLARRGAARGKATIERELQAASGAAAAASEQQQQLAAALGALLGDIDAAVETRLHPQLLAATSAALAQVSEARGSSSASAAPLQPRSHSRAWSPLDLPPASPHLTLHLCFLAWSFRGAGGVAAAQELVVARCTRPLLSRLLSQGRLDEGGSRGSYRGIAGVFEEYLGEASAVGDWLLQCCGAAASTPTPPPAGLAGIVLSALHCPGFSPVPALLWAPLVDHFATSLPSFFFPAHPAIFHSNYNAISAFFSRLRIAAGALDAAAGEGGGGAAGSAWGEEGSEGEEAAAPGEAAGEAGSSSSSSSSSDTALVRHPSTIALAGVWRPKLGVYATLRAQEASSKLEKLLTGAGSRVSYSALAAQGAAGGAFPPSFTLLLSDALAPPAAQPATGWHCASALHTILQAVAAAAPAATAATAASRAAPAPATAPFALPAAQDMQAPCSFYFPAIPSVLWGILHTIWSPATHFLPPLLPNTLQLSQQLLSRYAAWHTAGIALCAAHCGLSVPSLGQLQQHLAASAAEAGSAGGAAAAPAAVPLSIALLQSLPALPLPFTRALTPGALTLALSTALQPAASAAAPSAAAPAAGGAPTPTPAPTPSPSSLVHPDLLAWLEAVRSPAGAEPLYLLLQARDLVTLAQLCTYWLASRALISASVQAEPAATPLATPLLAPILTTAAHLHDLSTYPRALACALLSRSAAAVAGAIRGVPGAMKAGGAGVGPVPTTPSPYAANILGGLKACLAHSSGALLPPHCPATKALVLTVATDAAAAFAGVLGSTLDSLSTLEASLQWLKKAAPAAAAAVSPAAEDGSPTASAAGAGAAGAGGAAEGIAVRIGVQLTLDCYALGKDIGSGSLGSVLGVQWDGEGKRLSAGGGGGGKGVEGLVAALQGALALCAPYAHLVQ